MKSEKMLFKNPTLFTYHNHEVRMNNIKIRNNGMANVLDFVPPLQATEREVVWVMRIAIFGVGAAATAMSLTVGSIYVLFHLCSDLVFVILFPQLCCVIYVKFSNTYGSIMGYILGLLLRVMGGEDKIGFPAFIKYPFYDEVKGQLFPFRTLSMIVSFITIIVVSYSVEYLFEREIIPLKYDFLNCFKKYDLEKPLTDDKGKPIDETYAMKQMEDSNRNIEDKF